MVLQLTDEVHYKGAPYEPFFATGMDGPLFNPEDFGMKPQWPHEGCSRGFVAKFEINFDRLYLTGLGVHLFVNPRRWVRGPTLHHVQPSFIRKWGFKHPDADIVFNDFNNYYALHSPINFSGPLLLGSGGNCYFDESSVCGEAFVREYEETIGPNHCQQHKTLLRLEFQDGCLIKEEDLSELNKKYREMFEAVEERQRQARALEDDEKNQEPFYPDDDILDEEPPF
ncbi:MAG: hypothetical protein GVY36_05545 [Verrucomicrobia bacterium]|jgi:hypothetical protein|nr:hypothetical protein [Verrucomicrobiota bacterium]